MFKKISLFFLLVILSFLVATRLTPYIREALLRSGLIKVEINISGTGSMYPTFPKGDSENDIVNASEIVAFPLMKSYPGGIGLFGFDFFNYKLGRGDIVEFENKMTKKISKEKYQEEAGFVKRIIGLPDDKIELRDGYTYVNGEIIDEPYTAKPRSTYGGSGLPDCQMLKIPDGKYFVMGDNRKASQDSRYELGLVNEEDIHYVIPWNEQDDFKSRWRNTNLDKSMAMKTTLDDNEFVRLLNEKRKILKLPALNNDGKLSLSAKIRGDTMLKNDDFSMEATRSGMTMEDSINKSGYKNIIYAEVFTRGYYEADELLDNFLEFPETKKILYSKEYQDIGISGVIGSINNCPIQVVVGHLGGYVAPNYSLDNIKSWEDLIASVEKALPNFQSYKNIDGVDQTKLGRVIEILNIRKSSAEKILARMKANQWLTPDEEVLAKQDTVLGEEADKLIKQLNGE